MVRLAVRIVFRAGVTIDDVGVMVAVGDDVRVTIEDQERRQPLDSFDDIAPDQNPALRREVPGNEQPQTVEFMGDDELAPKIRQQDTALATINGLGVRVALREIEFLFGGVDVDPVAGQHAVVDFAMGHREIALGLDRDVVRPKHRVAAAVHLVDRNRNRAVAMRVFEREVDPDLGRRRQPLDVEFTCRDHHLPLGAIDPVAVDVDAGKGVIGAQALDLLQLGLERAPVPDARIPQRCRVLIEIVTAERRCRNREFLFFDVRPGEPISLPRAGDAADEIRLLKGNLVGPDIEMLDRSRDDRCCEVERGKNRARRHPMRRRGEQPATQARYAGGRRQKNGGCGPAGDDHGIGRQPEMDIDKGGAGDDGRMPADDEVVSGEKPGEAETEAEQGAQYHPLAKPAFPCDPAGGE